MLIAVVITTLLSWVIGFEHNATVSTRSIVSPRLPGLIEAFNSALVQQQQIRDLRSEGSQSSASIARAPLTSARAAIRQEHIGEFRNDSTLVDDAGMPNRALALHQLAGLLDIHIADVGEGISEYRAAIRSIVFVRIEYERWTSDVFRQ